MRLGAFEIKINPLGKPAWIWSKILAALTIGFFIYGLIQTHGMLSYRTEYVKLIPRQSQLISYGPVYMATRLTRTGPMVSFYGQNGETLFSEKFFSIPINNVLALVKEYTGRPIAILWIYKGNPSRLVWEVDVNNERILDLKQAINEYKIDDSFGYGDLWASLIFAIWFVVSIFEVERARPVS